MSDKTKAVNLTEDEIVSLIQYHGRQLQQSGNIEEAYIERINYLNRRLKAFKEPETEIQSKPENASGWGTENG